MRIYVTNIYKYNITFLVILLNSLDILSMTNHVDIILTAHTHMTCPWKANILQNHWTKQPT